MRREDGVGDKEDLVESNNLKKTPMMSTNTAGQPPPPPPIPQPQPQPRPKSLSQQSNAKMTHQRE